MILRIQRLDANTVDPDEVAHDEPPHQDLHCLEILRISFLVLQLLINMFLSCKTAARNVLELLSQTLQSNNNLAALAILVTPVCVYAVT